MLLKTTKYIVIIVAGFFLLWGCEEFLRRKVGGFAGSYPFVEYWDINAREDEIVNAIKELNKTNPNFQPPENIELISTRDPNNKRDYWLDINLYYPDTKEIVRTWTRPDSDQLETTTTFALVNLKKAGTGEEPKFINRDFWYLANKRQIDRFEATFVIPIQEQIRKSRLQHR